MTTKIYMISFQYLDQQIHETFVIEARSLDEALKVFKRNTTHRDTDVKSINSFEGKVVI